MVKNLELSDIESVQLHNHFESRSLHSDDGILLRQALDSVGSSAFGIIAISVWFIKEGSSHLIQPINGFWIDPIFRRENSSVALEMLLDDQRIDYAHPRPLIPGEGLEGLLYSECMNKHRETSAVFTKRLSVQRMIHRDCAYQNDPYNIDPSKGLVFRSLKHIVEDEDQPYNRRLSLMVEAGIGKALGIPLQHQSMKGIVVYMVRQTARENELLDPVFTRHLFASTLFISGLLVFTSHRRHSKSQIDRHLNEIYRRIHKKVMAIHNVKQCPCSQNNILVDKTKTNFSKNKQDSWLRKLFPDNGFESILDQVKIWGCKCKGGNVPLPPPKSWISLRFTFCAAFIHLFVLYWCDHYIVRKSHGRYNLQRGTIGSNVSSFYLLTASPASQPIPLIIGQTICVSVALVLKYFRRIPLCLRVPCSGALSTMILARLSLTTPSATALAIAFTFDNVPASRESWIALAIICCQTLFSVLLATILNNISNKRQYPTNWICIRR